MHNIEATSYGFRLTVTGAMNTAEAEEQKLELLQTLSTCNQPFSLLVDVRGLIPAEPEVFKEIEEMQTACKLMSVRRTAIVFSSPVLKAQIKQGSFVTGTVEVDRFIDASRVHNWEEQALAWVVEGIEPVSTSVEENTDQRYKPA